MQCPPITSKCYTVPVVVICSGWERTLGPVGVHSFITICPPAHTHHKGSRDTCTVMLYLHTHNTDFYTLVYEPSSSLCLHIQSPEYSFLIYVIKSNPEFCRSPAHKELRAHVFVLPSRVDANQHSSTFTGARPIGSKKIFRRFDVAVTLLTRGIHAVTPAWTYHWRGNR